MHHRVTRTARARRRSGGQKTPQWGVFRARESPRWCTRKSRNEFCGFFVAPFPSGRTRTSRKRSCSSRGDWSLKMAAGLWAGATIERERKRGANNSISISSHTVPASDCYYSANIRGMSVLVPDLPLIRQRLEEYLPLE